jgi:hypothetical protein
VSRSPSTSGPPSTSMLESTATSISTPSSTLNLLPTITSQSLPLSDDTSSPSNSREISSLIVRITLPTSIIILLLCALIAFKLQQLVENDVTKQFGQRDFESCHGVSVKVCH